MRIFWIALAFVQSVCHATKNRHWKLGVWKYRVNRKIAQIQCLDCGYVFYTD